MDIKDNHIDKQDVFMLDKLKKRLKEYLPKENVIQLKVIYKFLKYYHLLI